MLNQYESERYAALADHARSIAETLAVSPRIQRRWIRAARRYARLSRRFAG